MQNEFDGCRLVKEKFPAEMLEDLVFSVVMKSEISDFVSAAELKAKVDEFCGGLRFSYLSHS